MRIFLLASFPSLSFTDKAPLSFAEFRARCAAHLSARELAELDAVCDTPPHGKTPFARDWARAQRQLRNLNERRRIRRLPPGALPMPPEEPPVFPRLQDVSTAAWEQHDPLRRETGLLLAQWTWLENRRRRYPFEELDLLAYGLQLRILERKQIWSEPEGTRVFNEQTETFLTPLLAELRELEISA